MKTISIPQAKETHEKLREILIKYGCAEYGDCIVDEISFLLGFPTTLYYCEEKKSHNLPNRVFNSPLIESVNFTDGSFINLIRLIKPYKNGDAYAIYETTINPELKSGMFKTYAAAKEKFEKYFKIEILENGLRDKGVTCNFTENNYEK